MTKPLLAEPTQQYLTFQVLKDVFAISTEYVREIIEYRTVTAVPLMPDFVRGVYNLRGEVVPVIDLAVRFGKGLINTGNRSCIIILDIPFEGATATLGALVDWVEDVVEVEASSIEPAPTFGARLQAHFIRGVARIEEQLIILLRAEHVLSIDEMSALIKKINQ